MKICNFRVKTDVSCKHVVNLTMKLSQGLWLVACVIASLNVHADAQRTFLDDLALRPAFRGMRKMFLSFNQNPSPDQAFQTIMKMGVSHWSLLIQDLNLFFFLETPTAIFLERNFFLWHQRTWKKKLNSPDFRSSTSPWWYWYRWCNWWFIDSR